MNSQRTLAELIIDRAQGRLDGQLHDNDALDVKALGLIAVDAAVLAVLIAAHGSLDRIWVIPAFVLAVAGFLFLCALWRRRFDAGPNWREFYEDYGWEPFEDVARQMLSDLLAAIEWNTEHGRRKDALYGAGFAASLVGLLAAGIVGLAR